MKCSDLLWKGARVKPGAPRAARPIRAVYLRECRQKPAFCNPSFLHHPRGCICDYVSCVRSAPNEIVAWYSDLQREQLLADTLDEDGGDTFDEDEERCFVLIEVVAEPGAGRAERDVVVRARPTSVPVVGRGSRRG